MGPIKNSLILSFEQPLEQSLEELPYLESELSSTSEEDLTLDLDEQTEEGLEDFSENIEELEQLEEDRTSQTFQETVELDNLEDSGISPTTIKHSFLFSYSSISNLSYEGIELPPGDSFEIAGQALSFQYHYRWANGFRGLAFFRKDSQEFVTTDSNSNLELSSNLLGAGLGYSFRPEQPWNPYIEFAVGFGTGNLVLAEQEFSSAVFLVPAIGVGLEVMAGSSLFLFGELSYEQQSHLLTFQDEADELTVSQASLSGRIGLGLIF